jgi:2,5-diamino-6-(ribosylamino)-4(3H)-pyrimidinone 5'-phosphate reductase
MLPKVIVHNSISLDGSLTSFEPNMELHYEIAGSYKPDAHLIGSNTIEAGIELYEDGFPPEEEKDFKKPERKKSLPYWVIPDTRGKLKGLLHTCRRFEFCRDVIVLVSETTPKEYLEHLRERNYDFHITGSMHADLDKSLKLLSSGYKVKKVLTDTGRILGNMLLEQGFASELSILVHPVIVGNKAYNIFGNINNNVSLKLVKKEFFSGGYVWLVYRISRKLPKFYTTRLLGLDCL